MSSGLAVAIIVASLLVGAWCFVTAARDRWIDLTHLVGLGLVSLALLVQAVVAVVRMGDAHLVEVATFIGYLITSVIVLPLSAVLAYLEQTRWGSVIAGAGAVVAAVLTLRLEQVWAIR